MTNKEIRTALMTAGTIFTMPTKFSAKGETVEFKINQFGESFVGERPEVSLSVSVNKPWGESMNVSKIGTKTMTMYSYNMMGTRCEENVRFENITIVSVGNGEPVI